MRHDQQWPQAGLDESGKHVPYGVPVVACVVVTDQAQLDYLHELGVVAVKTLNDSALRELDRLIRQRLPVYRSEVTMEDYNTWVCEAGGEELPVLGRLHAETLHQAWQNGPLAHAVVDQFSAQDHISPWLCLWGTELPEAFLEQGASGEPAVKLAAAAICARVAFMDQLAALEQAFALCLRPAAGQTRLILAQEILHDKGETVFRAIFRQHTPLVRSLLDSD